jgi:hypothetical protein
MTYMSKNDNQYFGVGGSKHKEGADIDKSVEYKHGPCGCGFLGQTITVSSDLRFLV